MRAESRRTSFYALTNNLPDAELVIERIEIPHYQRDYAQGRGSDSVIRIRTDFLDVLFTAIDGDDQAAIGLDFVYGGVDEGTLRPLDGQQRLTTLFLLHWYIASRSGHLAEDHGWKRFSYATRPSARMFCESLVEAPLPDDVEKPSEWITDQAWYLFVWRHDPTIQSMLVMIDAIHERFQEVDAAAAWARLTDVNDPAVWFLLLPLSGLSSGSGQEMRPEDLYIKMNSRGKPLTEFENFKARFEQTIQSSPRSGEFALKVDTTWSDLLWHLKGDDFLIDDEFMRYMEFVTEVCEWRDGRNGAGQRLGPRTLAVFGEENPRHEAHLEFLFQAFDVWVGRSIPEKFESLFTSTGDDQGDESRVRLFFRNDGDQSEAVNLFEACCRSYESVRGARNFSLSQTIMLYAVVLHLIEDIADEDIADFRRRARIIRNLVEASSDELRLDKMPEIIEDVHRIVRDGAIEHIAGLNQAQVEDEIRKAAFLEENPGLRRAVFTLEDHDLLRGSLGAFEYEAATFERRASVFQRLLSQPDLWPDLLSALLAVGEYQRQRNPRSFLFGTDSTRHARAWRDLLTGATRDRLRPTREVLTELLDFVASASAPLDVTLQTITQGYLARCETEGRFDWRYYMVKYPAMREEGASIYYAEPMEGVEQRSMSYSLCMLRGGHTSLKGYYRDPYLLAIWRQLEDSGVAEDKWFIGFETEPRKLPLTRSGAGIRCVPAGFGLSPPPLDAHAKEFAAACADLGANADNVVVVPQAKVDHGLVDTVDRIQFGADIVRRLIATGL